MTTEDDEQTYKIVRRYLMDRAPEVITHGLTLKQAQAHCNDPETSSTTCTEAAGIERTQQHGPWFDGYEKE